jgi:hypothetical protein
MTVNRGDLVIDRISGKLEQIGQELDSSIGLTGAPAEEVIHV